MPQTKRMAWAQLRVGLMAVAAIAILVVLVFVMSGSGALFRKRATVRTFVDDSASLKIGAPVRLNGIDIGNVDAVGLSGLAEPGRTIEVVMKVNREALARIPVDSQSSINPEGVFGDKYVNITRGKSAQAVADGGEIPSLDTREFQEIVNQSYNVLTSLNAITKRIDSITQQVEKGQGTIGKLLYDDALYKRLDGVVEEAHQVVAAVGEGKGTLGKLLNDDALYNDIRSTTQRVDTVLADVQSGKGTLGMLLRDPALYQNATRVTAEAVKVMEGVNAGQGTLGKFLKDDAVYRRVDATLGRVETTIDRVNAGQGTLGQLLVNRALYDTMNGMTAETRDLIRDIRADPRKFLRIKLALF
jgi:phospholipid/cholesterol/gamma-HCH transport system substrate-binding protein